MNEIGFNREIEPIRTMFDRFSPKQVRDSLEQLQQDLDDRSPEVSTGISIGDHFERKDDVNDAMTTWVLRPRILQVLDRLAAVDDRAHHVGLVRMEHVHTEELTTWQVWAGWMPVEDTDNLTDQEWARVRDDIEFKPINAGVTQQ